MLMTPDFSAKIPPSPASTMGAASRAVDAAVLVEKTIPARSPAIEPGNSSPSRPSRPSTAAVVPTTSDRT